MFLKLGMRHQGEELYKVYINHDPGMTLTYFMARSAEVSYPRSQVSVYRTIGPLVIIVMKYSYKTESVILMTNVSPWLDQGF